MFCDVKHGGKLFHITILYGFEVQILYLEFKTEIYDIINY